VRRLVAGFGAALANAPWSLPTTDPATERACSCGRVSPRRFGLKDRTSVPKTIRLPELLSLHHRAKLTHSSPASRRDATTNDSQPRSVRQQPGDRLPACQQALPTGWKPSTRKNQSHGVFADMELTLPGPIQLMRGWRDPSFDGRSASRDASRGSCRAAHLRSGLRRGDAGLLPPQPDCPKTSRSPSRGG